MIKKATKQVGTAGCNLNTSWLDCTQPILSDMNKMHIYIKFNFWVDKGKPLGDIMCTTLYRLVYNIIQITYCSSFETGHFQWLVLEYRYHVTLKVAFIIMDMSELPDCTLKASGP